MPPRLPLLGRASATTALLHRRVASYPSQCVRLYSATNPTTPVEAPPPLVPSPHHERLKQTLATLSALGHGGSPSRIGLALRGLEQIDAPVRIAVFGAEILPEVLGGDAAWSRMLEEWVSLNQVENPGGGLLLRFGEFPKITTPTGSPLSILTAPIEVLRVNNIEIIVASKIPADLLVPLVQTPGVPGARVIEYPVHKALFYAGSGTNAVLTLLDTITPIVYKSDRVLRLVSLPGHVSERNNTKVIDLDRDSSVEDVKEWLLAGTTTSNTLRPVIKSLLLDIFVSASKELSAAPGTTANPMSIEAGDTFETLARAIGAWSRAAHIELKTAAESHEWHKLDWWKLLWRVDDVGHISRHVMTTSFLAHSEEEAAFLAGRLLGAGYNNPTSLGGSELELDRPTWITEQRNQIRTALIPSLQSGAQKYLFSSLSTSGLSAAFSALLCLSDVPLYSALTVAALGTVGSMRWLQSRWMREKRGFQDAVKEKGRVAIVESERWAWKQLKQGRKIEVSEEDEKAKKREQLKNALEDGMKLLR